MGQTKYPSPRGEPPRDPPNAWQSSTKHRFNFSYSLRLHELVNGMAAAFPAGTQVHRFMVPWTPPTHPHEDSLMTDRIRRFAGVSLALLTTACVTERVVVREPAPRPYSPPPVYEPPPPPVVSVYIDEPIGQPDPIACPWAPPPMLVEAPPPPPFEDAIWTGGYWVWHDTWVWAHGRWSAPPRPHYRWHPPYYEHRDDVVVFITGHWGAPDRDFVPPPPGLRLTVERGGRGVIPGPRPIGPPGVFVPPPPGSRRGLIVPAPVGTSPAVVTSAPPVVNVGMRITNNVNNSRTTVVNNVTTVTNVTIVAPPSATASGQAMNASVPGQAHLAAGLPPVVRTPAPPPANPRPIPAFTHGQPHVDLPPPPQPARPQLPPPRPAPQAAPVPPPQGPAPQPASPQGPTPRQDHANPPQPRNRAQEAPPPRRVDQPRPEGAQLPREQPIQRDKGQAKPVEPPPKERPKPKEPVRPNPKDEKDPKKNREHERD